MTELTHAEEEIIDLRYKLEALLERVAILEALLKSQLEAQQMWDKMASPK